MRKKEPTGRTEPPPTAAGTPPDESPAAKPARRKRAPAGPTGTAAGTRAKAGAKPGPAMAKTVALAQPADSIAPALSSDRRRALIARAAYFRAEKRGFAPGGEAQDWLEAEHEIDLLLLSGKPLPP